MNLSWRLLFSTMFIYSVVGLGVPIGFFKDFKLKYYQDCSKEPMLCPNGGIVYRMPEESCEFDTCDNATTAPPTTSSPKTSPPTPSPTPLQYKIITSVPKSNFHAKLRSQIVA